MKLIFGVILLMLFLESVSFAACDLSTSLSRHSYDCTVDIFKGRGDFTVTHRPPLRAPVQVELINFLNIAHEEEKGNLDGAWLFETVNSNVWAGDPNIDHDTRNLIRTRSHVPVEGVGRRFFVRRKHDMSAVGDFLMSFDSGGATVFKVENFPNPSGSDSIIFERFPGQPGPEIWASNLNYIVFKSREGLSRLTCNAFSRNIPVSGSGVLRTKLHMICRWDIRFNFNTRWFEEAYFGFTKRP